MSGQLAESIVDRGRGKTFTYKKVTGCFYRCIKSRRYNFLPKEGVSGLQVRKKGIIGCKIAQNQENLNTFCEHLLPRFAKLLQNLKISRENLNWKCKIEEVIGYEIVEKMGIWWQADAERWVYWQVRNVYSPMECPREWTMKSNFVSWHNWISWKKIQVLR